MELGHFIRASKSTPGLQAWDGLTDTEQTRGQGHLRRKRSGKELAPEASGGAQEVGGEHSLENLHAKLSLSLRTAMLHICDITTDGPIGWFGRSPGSF